MNNRTRELWAVAAAIGELESIVEHVKLPEPVEQSARVVLAELLSAFRMPSKHELDSNVVELFPRQLGCTDEPLVIPPEFADDNSDWLLELLESDRLIRLLESRL